METQLSREIFFKDETFSLEYQIKDNIVAIHCDVFSWTPSSLRRGYKVFGKLLDYFKQQGFGFVVTATPNPKFVKLFGGTTIQKITYENKEYEVIVWDLK